VHPLDQDNKIRTIAVDLTPVLPGGENGGAKVLVIELLSRLAELAPRTQFVLLTSAITDKELAKLDGPNIRRLLVRGADTSSAVPIRAISRLLRRVPRHLRLAIGRFGYRLLWSPKRNQSGILLRSIGADLLFCPFTAPTYSDDTTSTVSVIHDLQYKAYPEFFTAEEIAYRDITFFEACKRSTLLAAVSDFSRQEALKRGWLEPTKIKTIHSHISVDRLQGAAKDETIIERLSLVRQNYLIYPANFWRHKNHEMLLTAFGIARSTGLAKDVRLVCTGAPGPRHQWLTQAAASQGLTEHVVFPGYLTSPELLTLISESAGVVFPSLFEGFGLPVVEAMAVGVPVACSNVTSLPELALDAAILFDPRIPEEVSKAMVSLVHDGDLRSRLIKAGRARATRFSDSRIMAQQYWDLFKQAVGSP
jgi:glycosyltransferase involved in cell wall biosynthesis